MLTRIVNWLSKRNRYQDGRDFAIASLKKHGDDAIKQLENGVNANKVFGDFDDFDRGILDVIRDHNPQEGIRC